MSSLRNHPYSIIHILHLNPASQYPRTHRDQPHIYASKGSERDPSETHTVMTHSPSTIAETQQRRKLPRESSSYQREKIPPILDNLLPLQAILSYSNYSIIDTARIRASPRRLHNNSSIWINPDCNAFALKKSHNTQKTEQLTPSVTKISKVSNTNANRKRSCQRRQLATIASHLIDKSTSSVIVTSDAIHSIK